MQTEEGVVRQEGTRIRLVPMLLAVALSLAGCGRGEGVATPSATPVEPTSTAPPTATQRPTPASLTVAVSPTSGPPQTRVQVSLSGYPPDAEIELGLGREDAEADVVGTAETDDEGALTTELTIPASARPDERWVVVVRTPDGAMTGVSNAFQVTRPEYEPSVSISPTVASPGTDLRVDARGFPPDVAVEVGVGRVDSEYDVVAAVQTDAEGRLETGITIPDFVQPPDAWVVVVAAEDPPVKAVSEAFEVALPATPTATASPTPTGTPTAVVPTPTAAAPTATPRAGLFTRTNIYLIAVGDEGRAGDEIGCGDSVVAVEVEIEPTLAPLTAALRRLLGIEDREVADTGLYNALHQSDLTLERVGIVDGEAIIELSGTLMLGGVCDEPRVEAQLAYTALQYRTVDRVSIFINGTPLEALLGERAPTGTPTAVAPTPTAAAPTATPRAGLFTRTNIYLIAVGDEGRAGDEIGCGDSVVAVEVEIEPTLAPLTAALRRLLGIEDREVADTGLYNALHQSDLTLERVGIVDGEAIIELSGTLMLGGVCDEPRVEAQLAYTALQYRTVDRVSIFINGTPLEALLGGSGG
ncbi:MAG: GerMN domain-containing protein [Chloroflexota bacterium]